MTARVLYLHSGFCPSTGKRAFRTRRLAKRAVRNFDRTLRPYRCDCGFWHVGHLPGDVIAGRVPEGRGIYR